LSISIIHFTDIHFNEKDNPILSKQESIYKACQSVLNNKDNVVLVISGDIAFSGHKNEYKHASELIEHLKNQLNNKLCIDLKIILTPGNHDCDFSLNQSVRNSLLTTLNKEDPIDGDILLQMNSVQNEFFNFAKTYSDINPSELCKKIIIEFGNKRLMFLAFNSSWMSTLEEKPGKLFMPKNAYLNICANEYDCVISVMHHPSNWLHPDNSTEFIDYIRQTTDILLLGHEHKKDDFKIVGPNWSLVECHGKELQGSDTKDSAFSIYQFDDAMQNLTTYDFAWEPKETIFKRYNENTVIFRRNTLTASSMLVPSKKFLQIIEDPGMIINHFNAEDITLSEIFCWPHLEMLELKDNFYIKSVSKIKENIQNKLLDSNISVIVGDALSGRTSLAKMLFKEYCSCEGCCIICNGNELTTHIELNLRKIIEKKFVEEYSESKIDIFRQFECEQRILIIDDFNGIPYHDDRSSKVLSILTKIFSHIIILSDDELEMQMICTKIDNISDIHTKFYEILYFGNTKREELVRKWYCLRDEYALGSEEIEEKIMNTCEKINNLLGSNGGIIPAAPIYLINMLQNLDSAVPSSFSGSQYGFLYDSLITKSLSTISNSYKDPGEINIDINVLSVFVN